MMLMNKPTVWIARCDHLGDLIITLPIVAQLVQNYHVKIIVEPYLYQFAKHLIKTVDVVLSNDFINVKQFSKNDILIPFKMSRSLRAHAKAHFDGLRLGYALRPKDWFFANKLVAVYRNEPFVHEAELLRRFAAAGVTGLRPLTPADYQTNWLLKFGFESPPVATGLANKPLIFHPGSNQNGREWPAFRWAELIQKAYALGHTIYVTGRSQEAQRFLPELAPVADQFINCIDQDADMVAFTNRVLTAGVLVSSGTGPAHLAASLGVPVVTLFPPIVRTGKIRWLPIGSQVTGLSSSQYSDRNFCAKARTCSSSDCSCMSEITADLVFDCLRQALA